jgi:hypothetical protein
VSRLNKWKNTTIQDDGGYTSDDFRKFATDFREDLRMSLPQTTKIRAYNKGHYYVSGFLLNELTGKYGYFSISDVRHFPNSWQTDILVRSAEHEKDYTGGSNNSATLETFPDVVERITR